MWPFLLLLPLGNFSPTRGVTGSCVTSPEPCIFFTYNFECQLYLINSSTSQFYRAVSSLVSWHHGILCQVVSEPRGNFKDTL